MALTRRTMLGATVATLPLAGCAGGSGGTATTEPDDATGTDPDTPTDDGTGMDAATVSVSDHPELGEILVGPDDMTLYMFDQDTQGESASTCYDGCAESWPPLTVEEGEEPTAGEGVTAELTTFEREDGTTQVSAGGWPLYYFTPDEEPGDVEGQGANDVWWVLRPDGTPVRPGEEMTGTPGGMDAATVSVSDHPELGEILVGPDGMTLYNFDQDTQGEPESTCYDGCAESWPPLTVEEGEEPTAGEGVTAELTTFEREDGTTQVAADGWPLYYFTPDEEPGDAEGQGANDVWWVLRPDGSLVRSDGSTATETGSVY
ncbi:hypothetical protein [Halorarum salinum]|uniref:Lipoprotein with Yx(FWY)xxD motif n=1 Tax=Halorarum salinum TaxID=2743089 RepID=A0A7D5LEN2_9EURY|nr:hypothetical protein [Halobaculum salinum]QLG64229.1 hypothetical protein HUG12_20815 [Halobaculum salinum]